MTIDLTGAFITTRSMPGEKPSAPTQIVQALSKGPLASYMALAARGAAAPPATIAISDNTPRTPCASMSFAASPDMNRFASASAYSRSPPGGTSPWLKRYPNAAVFAPFAKLPPDSSDAVPPTTVAATNPPTGSQLDVTGVTSDPNPPDIAPDRQLPPPAAVDAQPTRAWPAMFSKCSALRKGCWCPVKFPTSFIAYAVAKEIAPALRMSLLPPPMSPVVYAEAPAAQAIEATPAEATEHAVVMAIV